MQFELLQESAEIATVLQHVQRARLFLNTTLYADSLPFEQGTKCFELDKSYGIVHEQQFALQDDWTQEAMYQKLCHVAMKHGKPVESNAKCEPKP